MSKVTTVLNKLGLFAEMRIRIDLRLPRISLNVFQMIPHFRRHADWASVEDYVEFQKAYLARRSAIEREGRLPVAR